MKNLVGNSGDGSAYHRYWAQYIYRINSSVGTEAGLIALSVALHSRGMYLIVDVVTIDIAYLGCLNCVSYSIFKLVDFVSMSTLLGFS